MKLQSLSGKKILNALGKWTIEVRVQLHNGITASASVPEGISKGKDEALYLPPEQALKMLPVIQHALGDKNLNDIDEIDKLLIHLDGTHNMSRLGANTTLAISIALARAIAQEHNMPLFLLLKHAYKLERSQQLPKMMVLAFEGGKHAVGALAIQELLLIESDIETAHQHYFQIVETLQKHHYATTVGAEGACSPADLKALQACAIAKQTGVPLALDVAAGAMPVAVQELRAILEVYPLYAVEDPCDPADIKTWQDFMRTHPELIVVADDLTVTNPSLIKTAIQQQAANAVVIKPNQIGTIAQAIEAAQLAQEAGWKLVTSHRAGETNDDFIADFAVAIDSDFVKFGGFSRGERIAKYNRLLAIREML